MVLTSGSYRRRYRQGHGIGHRRYRQGRGPKMQKLKGFTRKATSFGKQHTLPHLQEIGTNTFLDIMEGKNVQNLLKNNLDTTRTNLVRQQRRRRRRRTTQYA